MLHDQKQVWLFPASLAHGKHWVPTAGFVLTTAGLVAFDSRDDPYFRRTQTFSQFNRVLSFNKTLALMAVVPTTAYVVGLVRPTLTRSRQSSLQPKPSSMPASLLW